MSRQDLSKAELSQQLETGRARPRVAEDGATEHQGPLEDLVQQRTAELTRRNVELGREMERANERLAEQTLERERTEESLRESEERYRLLFDEMISGFALCEIICDDDGRPIDFRFLEINPAFTEVTGLSRCEVVGRTVLDIYPGTEPSWIERYGKVALTGQPISFVDHHRDTGKRYESHAFCPRPGQFAFTFTDTAERIEVEEALAASHRLLEVANRHNDLQALLDDFVVEVKRFCECDAVGIRIVDEQGRIPYLAYDGFSREFYEEESPLSVGSDQCMCINVITGDTNANHPFCTPGGSFYLNGTTRFLATVPEEEKMRTRNVCNAAGYESVALVPIRSAGRILGLIHVADRQENRVPVRLVSLLEGVAMELGTAVDRVAARQQVRDLAKFPSENPHPVFRVSADGAILYRNASAESLLGLCECSNTYRSPGLWSDSVAEALDTGRPQGIEVEREGRVFALSFAPVVGQRYVNAYGLDITDRKLAERELAQHRDRLEEAVAQRTAELSRSNEQLRQEIRVREEAERELREARDFLQSVINGIPDPTMVIAPDYQVVLANRAAQQVEPEGLASEPPMCYEVNHRRDTPCDGEHERCPLREVCATGKPVQVVHRHESASGQGVVQEISAAPIFDERGEVALVVEAARDITRRERAEGDAQRQRDALANVTRVATTGVLAAAVAHELNRPIAAILSNAQASIRFLASDTPDLDEVRGALEDIVGDSERAAGIIAQLRDLLSKGRAEQVPLALDDVICEAISIMGTEARARGVAIRPRLAAGLPPVLADRVHLEQVIMNLLLNGVEAMEASDPATRELVVRAEQSDSKMVTVTVADWGVGLDEAEVDRLFDPFFTTKADGLGLGLAITRTIVEAHGGRVWAENNLDGGASFSFSIPAWPGGPS